MEQPTGGEDNANDGKKEADHKNDVNDLSSKSKGGEELPPENVTDGKSIAMENHNNNNNHKLKKSVHWSEELVTESPLHSSSRQTQSSSGAGTSNPYAAYSSSFNFKNSMVNVKEALGRWRKKVGEASKKAEDLAENTWQHLKTAPSITDAALGRIAQGTKVLAEGGYENIFRQTFDSDPDEHLQNYFACYLSTSAGPVMGVLYVSTAKLAFCSDNPLSYKVDDKTEWSYYKVVVPLHQLKAVNTSSSKTNVAEKYIQIISADNHEFWYMGFLNYDTAVQSLLNTHEFSNLNPI